MLASHQPHQMSKKRSKSFRKRKELKHIHKKERERRRPDTRREANHVRSEPIVEEENPTEVNISETGKEKVSSKSNPYEESRHKDNKQMLHRDYRRRD